MRELQLELAAYRKTMEQSMKIERLLQDRLSNVEHDYSTFRNESRDFERRLQGQITQLKEEFAEYKNGSIDNQTTTADELKRQGKYFLDN